MGQINTDRRSPGISKGTAGMTNFRKGRSVIFFSDCDGVAKINVNSGAIVTGNWSRWLHGVSWAVRYTIKEQSLITRVCCEAVRSAILAAAWLLVYIYDHRNNTQLTISCISVAHIHCRISLSTHSEPTVDCELIDWFNNTFIWKIVGWLTVIGWLNTNSLSVFLRTRLHELIPRIVD